MSVRKHKYSFYEAFVLFICGYTISTLIGNKFPSFPIARIMGICISIVIVLIIGKHLTKKLLLSFALTLISIMISFAVAFDFSANLKDAFWFLSTVLCVALGTDRCFRNNLMHAVQEKKKVIYYTVLICDAILIWAIITPSSYGNAWSWGESEGYFIGFAQNGHTLCSCCCLLLVLIMLVFQGTKMRLKEYLLYFPPIYGVFFSGARTFLIPVAVLLLSGVFIKVKNKKMRAGICVVLIAAFIVFLKNSSMMDKFYFTANNKYASNFLSSITNGRSDFWLFDLKTFFNYNLWEMLFGKGFDYIYRLNKTAYGLPIYAHNDLINFLVCVGSFGTLVYFSNWVSFTIRTQKETYSKEKLEYSTKILFTTYVWAPMLLNGMFAYQHYVYSCVLLSIFYYGFEKRNHT